LVHARLEQTRVAALTSIVNLLFLPNSISTFIRERRMQHNKDFQLGLLHLVHLLVSVDGHVDDRERAAIKIIKKEEDISDGLFLEFEQSVNGVSNAAIYERGIAYLKKCTEEDCLTAFVYLYQLAEADTSISSKEVRFLFYGLNATKISFEDVIMSSEIIKKGIK
jgi:uncharacterized tellurite resistance protein B-like protein